MEEYLNNLVYVFYLAKNKSNVPKIPRFRRKYFISGIGSQKGKYFILVWTQETLGGEQGLEHAGGVEQQQGEKPPWDLSYMIEEESSLQQMILQEKE